MTALTHSEAFVLKWLSREERSHAGECRGPALEGLIDKGLAHIVVPARDPDYSWVALTEKGWEARRELRGT